MGRKGHPLAARIKKIMQTDEDVGKIAQATPIMIARALELFLQRLCTNSSEIATARKAKTLTCSHVKAYVNSDELMDFLQDTVAKAPDLPPEGEPEQPKAKRQRTGEPKPRAPKGEGKGKGKQRESADGAAAAAAAAGAGATEDADELAAAAATAAAADVPEAQPPAAAAAAAVLPAVQAAKQDRGSSSPTAAQAKPGFGGLGAHPFLAARTFGKPGAKKPSASPKPESPLKQQAPAAAGAAQPQQQQQQQQLPEQLQQQPQLPEEQGQSAYAEVAPSLLPAGLSAKILAGFAPQQQQMEEDDYDDDYDS